MIPTIEDIVADLVAGKIDARLALAWLNQHVKLASESSLSARDEALEAQWDTFLEAVRVEDGLKSKDMNFLGDAKRYKEIFLRALRSPAKQNAASASSPGEMK